MSEWEAIVTNKDGIMALIKEKDLDTLIWEKLDPTQYVPMTTPMLNVSTMHGICRIYLELARKISEAYDDPALLKEVRKSLAEGSICSELNAQLDSHEEVGDVSVRLLHGSYGHKFASMAQFLAEKMGE